LHHIRQLTEFVKLALRQCHCLQLIGVAMGVHYSERVEGRTTGIDEQGSCGFALCWRRNRMLRIRRSANGDVLFTLSGRIDKEDVAELETLIAAEGEGRRITLDLRDMTLTGQDGIWFLAQCEATGISLVNCDPYVREWITRQRT